jgi:hypothetical protein
LLLLRIFRAISVADGHEVRVYSPQTAAGITEGPSFHPVNRHGQLQPARLWGGVVATVVKRWAAAARLEPPRYVGHRLRVGLATSVAAARGGERAIMN